MAPRGYLSDDAPRSYRVEGDEPSTVTIERSECIRASVRAIRVRLGDADGAPLVWIPQAVIHEDSEVYAEKHVGRLVIARWWTRLQAWGKDFGA